MQKIMAWEIAPRGLYTGTIGWATKDQIRANVAIRTIVLDPPVDTPHHESVRVRTGLLGVGSGIVWDSDAQDEYAECLLKSDFLVKPDPDFTLFETLRLQTSPRMSLSTSCRWCEIYPYAAAPCCAACASRPMPWALTSPDAAGFEDRVLWEVKNCDPSEAGGR